MIGILSWFWIALLLVGQPLAAFLGRKTVAAQIAPRLRLYRGSATGIVAIGVVTLILDLGGRQRTLASVAPHLSSTLVIWSILTPLA